MSVQNYIAIFKDLTHRSDVREHQFEITTKFIWDLKPKLQRVLITSSYDLNTVEKAFDIVLKLDLTFKTIVNAKARRSKCEGYGHHYYQCPLESQHTYW